ncbi:unnamed protein product [Didymodactylos carnosus]|uniref:Uncharacterized protein n=1 Tax=Didymodactylos carnosus TaxID=1234261 RepID=A0A813RFC5_9BILA|nr:unnamed protein product [Didymodactylos carnosus]CAF1016201.1 unnamed protein product [Didymodactylos carnosus]CAF3566547.1 unnamed protein product [Didymodactylos carnosus]CAF3785278.1 unnamed protein product [Didymodactylos carnosus]
MLDIDDGILIESSNELTSSKSSNNLMEKRIALRQKLKFTLLTLSPPKYYYNLQRFIPMSRCTEFLEIQGLDVLLNYVEKWPIIVDTQTNIASINNWPSFSDSRDVLTIVKDQTLKKTPPQICHTCHTDHTPNWFKSIDNKNNNEYFLCDNCERVCQRKMVLTNYREAMKSAFFQAKACERKLEIEHEKRIQPISTEKRKLFFNHHTSKKQNTNKFSAFCHQQPVQQCSILYRQKSPQQASYSRNEPIYRLKSAEMIYKANTYTRSTTTMMDAKNKIYQ